MFKKIFLAAIISTLFACSGENSTTEKTEATTENNTATQDTQKQVAENQQQTTTDASTTEDSNVPKECTTIIGSDDNMRFDTKNVEIPTSCNKFTFTLKHNGKMPAASMGHNIVITLKKDMQKVAMEGAKAGIKNDYVKKSDTKIIAHTKIIGGGESTSVTVDVDKLRGNNTSGFCSFPAHFNSMQFTIAVK